MEKKHSSKNYSPEVRDRAARLVLEHVGDYPSRKAAIISVASKIGCGSSTLHSWIVQAEKDPKGQLPERRVSASRFWSVKFGNCVRPMRSFVRHQLILPWRSSTAVPNHEVIY